MLYLEDQVKHVKLSNGEMSAREYATVRIQTVMRKEYDYYPSENIANQREFYLDPSTGLVVFDIEQYELWAPKPETPEQDEDDYWA